ncbi:MAG: response regulator [Planctomycetaceae bacterium]|nr:response regulator [Planctomycetaceae bacterium]
MNDRSDVLVFGVEESAHSRLLQGLRELGGVASANSVAEALNLLSRREAPSLCLMGNDSAGMELMLEAQGLMNQFPEGILLIDEQEEILWFNAQARQILGCEEQAHPGRLFEIWPDAQLVGPDFCPVNSVLATGKQSRTRVRVSDHTFYDLTVSEVVIGPDGGQPLLLATLRDTSEENLQQQKLTAIYQAGLDLGDLKPDEVADLSTLDRIELLKSKLLGYIQDLLEFETVEIRVIDQTTGVLKPLLAFGMDPTAAQRELFVSPEGNGVTGFVAATGRSYLCEDTEKDPLYIVGATGARSSLTVPLIHNEQVLGTFNVESFRPGAFSPTDLQYLELFCREVSVALNTLDLLVAEKAVAIEANAKKVLCEVADPVDEMLNDATWIFEKFSDQDPQVHERLQRILRNTQEIREVIRQVGASVIRESGGDYLKKQSHPQLAGKRVLVMDKERDIRHSAHELLEQFDVIIETARDGEQAIRMARTFHYDAVIADIKPPDIKGSELYSRLREMHQHLPIILMTGFGWDAEHTVVKCRPLGLKTILYKPFILNQVLKALTEAVAPNAGSGGILF